MVSPSDLRALNHLSELPESELQWLINESEAIVLEKGEVLFKQDTPVAHLIVILEGSLLLVRQEGGQEVATFTLQAGELTGVFPFSRMKAHRVTATAQGHVRVLQLPKDHFRAMRDEAPELEQKLVSLMSDRIREFTQLDQQREKLIALGKLSAGLAHELNNPAAANRRAASQLHGALDTLQARLIALLETGTSAESLATLNTLQQDILRQPPTHLSALKLSALEDELTDWLEDHEIAESWTLAPTFAQQGMTPETLEAVAGAVAADALGPALRWLEAGLNVHGLVHEIEESSKRISALVGSVKDYTYMDQAPLQDLDLREGLESTLTMLGHKLRDIQVVRDYAEDLPKVCAYGSELNQVWTNLIDNAADAMQGQGTLTLRTSLDGDMALVEVIDSGPGIPEDIQGRIFEPFFTTKEVGKGSGLGLDISHRIIVRRHGGSLRFSSRPGETRFTARLPLTQPNKT